MRPLTYLLKSINLLNVLLVAAVVSIGFYLLYPLLNVKVAYKPPPVAKQAPEAKEEKPSQAQSPPLSDYMVVAEQNIFHPERKNPPEAKDEKAQPRPEIFLYGTLLADNLRLAYIEDKKSPQTTPGRGKRQTVAKQGDVIGGYVLKSVDADRIVLKRGEEQMVVYLTDAKKQREVFTPSVAPIAMPGTPQQGVAPAASTPLQPRPPTRTLRGSQATGPGAVQPQQ